MSAMERTEQEEALRRFRAYRRSHDRALRNELVEEYMPLARSLARRFANRSEPFEDLEQVAVLGVLKAVERFDPELGKNFHAFAIPTVLGEVRRHFRDRGWVVRVPRRLQDLHLKMDAVVSRLSQQLGRSPTTAELAEATGVDEEAVLEALDIGSAYRPSSIEAATPSGVGIADRLGEPDNELGSVENRVVLLELMSRLPARQQQIMYLRFFEDMTQAEIAAEIGVSQMHVSRLITRGLEALQLAAD
jgi:RNA polymerase sigma-B factor